MISEGRILQLVEIEKERREVDKIIRIIKGMDDNELHEYHKKIKEGLNK